MERQREKGRTIKSQREREREKRKVAHRGRGRRQMERWGDTVRERESNGEIGREREIESRREGKEERRRFSVVPLSSRSWQGTNSPADRSTMAPDDNTLRTNPFLHRHTDTHVPNAASDNPEHTNKSVQNTVSTK